jgi:hypothetical protein
VVVVDGVAKAIKIPHMALPGFDFSISESRLTVGIDYRRYILLP